ncbi:hypothetical protein OROMI_028169 [Orobanche minor]
MSSCSHVGAGLHMDITPSIPLEDTTLMNIQLFDFKENMDLKGRASSIIGQTRVISDTIDQLDRASKLVKLNCGIPSSQAINISATTMTTVPFPTSRTPGRQASGAETLDSEKQATQYTKIQLPTDVDSTLLQQVLSLTPEQLSSLPPDQQQQVIQLQQMLRQTT